MICYRDKTFCPYNTCKCFEICQDAYTYKVKAEAIEWWGNSNPPVSFHAKKPGCYEGTE